MEELLRNVDAVSAIFKLGAAALGFFAAFAALWWKISKSFVTMANQGDQFDKDLKKLSADLAIDLKELRESLQRQIEKLVSDNLEMTKLIVTLATRTEEREKGVLKLEGVVEAQRKDLVTLIGTLQKTTSSVEALWKTISVALPEKIPMRALDKNFEP